MPDPTNLKEIREMLQSLDIHYGWVSKTAKLAGPGITHLVNGDLDEATTKISKMIEEAYSKGYSKGAADTKRVYLKMVDFAQELKKNQLQPPIPLQVNPKSHNYTTSKEETKDDKSL